MMLEIIEKVLKQESSWYEEERDINTFYDNFNNYTKWNTVFPCMCYKKLIERKILLQKYFVRGKNEFIDI